MYHFCNKWRIVPLLRQIKEVFSAMKKGTVLAIDDDANLQFVIGSYLEDDGYNVIQAENSKLALEKASNPDLDVILLDLVLPDAEGMTLIPQLQAKTNAGIIIVSGKNDTTEKIICLEMGADDYITKPFEMRELAARIKAIMRRSTANDISDNAGAVTGEKLVFNNGWCLNRAQFQLFNQQEESANLTTGEFKLLEALLLSPNRALSREHLFELTRDGEFDAYDRAIDIQIGRLRKKLSNDNQDVEEVIKTVRGVGYMFVGEVDKT